MTLFFLAIRIFLREIKSGQMIIMLMSLIVAIGILSSIALFSDRLQKSLDAESREFLGGDLKFESSYELDELLMPKVDFDYSKSHVFGSVLSFGDEFRLATVKSVDSFYPLEGEIELSNALNNYFVTSPPKSGEVWLDKRILDFLGVDIGQSISLGDKDFLVSNTIVNEPDRGSSSFAFAPRAIINSIDLKETNILKPGSRVRYMYLFKAEQENLDIIENYFQNIKKPGDEIVFFNDESSPLGESFSRASNFFLLGAFLSIIIASLTVSICTLQFIRKHISYVAILKALGLSPKNIRFTYLSIFGLIGVVATVLGILMGWLIQLNFIFLLKDYFPTNFPSAGPQPYLISGAIVFFCLLVFSFPVLSRLFKVPPNEILRKSEFEKLPIFKIFINASLGLIFFYLLLILFTQNILLTNIIFFSIMALVLFIFALVFFVFAAIKPESLNPLKPLKMIFFELNRRKFQNSLQIISLTLSIAISLIAFSASSNLISAWKTSLPDTAPNNFAINITETEIPDFLKFLEKNDVKSEKIYPVTSARFFKVNPKKEDEKIDRTFNFTWMTNLPEGNQIIEGSWFGKEKNGISISNEISERYNLKLNDKITIEISGKSRDSYVQSIREVNWENFSPNFFAIGYKEDFENNVSTYITSFFVSQDKKTFSSEFIKRFPTVSIISLSELIAEIQGIISKVSEAFKLILGLTVVSSIFLLIATVQESFKQREKQAAILKTIGASSKLLQRNSFLEFLSLALIAGFLGSSLAQTTTYFLEKNIFEIEPKIYLNIWFVGMLASVIVIGVLSLIFSNLINRKTPKEVLYDSN
ncbi:MAG: FtsX-like permease family protein [Gammaproteobacteria bacterium]|nr:MAG: FtsX-like permease family protein [Gammaproteobacteria bacterium]